MHTHLSIIKHAKATIRLLSIICLVVTVSCENPINVLPLPPDQRSCDIDEDGDGFYSSTECDGLDCNDHNREIHPNAIEIEGNRIDDDCDNVFDEGPSPEIPIEHELPIEDDTGLPMLMDGDGNVRFSDCDSLAARRLHAQFNQRVNVPVIVHVVTRDDGTGGLTENQVEQSIGIANRYFADLNVEFSIEEIRRIIDSDYYSVDDREERFEMYGLFNEPGVINIYYVGSYAGYAGAATFPHYELQGVHVINTSAINRTTIAHELGHFFNLLHTHETFRGEERVDGSNCEDAGDLLCDTPADGRDVCEQNVQACTLANCEVDANGDRYAPDIGNLMSYYSDRCNDDSFSNEQQQMMLCTMQGVYSDLLGLENGEPEAPCLPLSVGFANSCFETIQEVIDSVEAGDEESVITIAPGMYAERIRIDSKSIVLASSTGDAEDVVIDGRGPVGTTIQITSEQNAERYVVRIENITLIGTEHPNWANRMISVEPTSYVSLNLDGVVVQGGAIGVYAMFDSVNTNGEVNVTNSAFSGHPAQSIYIQNNQENMDIGLGSKILRISDSLFRDSMRGIYFSTPIHTVEIRNTTFQDLATTRGHTNYVTARQVRIHASRFLRQSYSNASIPNVTGSGALFVHQPYSGEDVEVRIEDNEFNDNDGSGEFPALTLSAGLARVDQSTISSTSFRNNNGGGIYLYLNASSSFSQVSMDNNTVPYHVLIGENTYNNRLQYNGECGGVGRLGRCNFR